MSVEEYVRMGSVLSVMNDVVTDGKVRFYDGSGNSKAYIQRNSNNLELYVGNQRSATFESDGGILHGSWDVETSLVTSDRRLKSNIMPLQRTLRDVIVPRGDKKAPASPPSTTKAAGARGTGNKKDADGALWLLRQLRPVSYSFRKGMDSKYMRFGFIADELETVVPEVVRHPGDREVSNQKAVVYQDLIALLAAASQSLADQNRKLAEKSEKLEEKSEKQQSLIEQLMERVVALETGKKEDGPEKKQRKRKPKRKRRASKQSAHIVNSTNTTLL